MENDKKDVKKDTITLESVNNKLDAFLNKIEELSKVQQEVKKDEDKKDEGKKDVKEQSEISKQLAEVKEFMKNLTVVNEKEKNDEEFENTLKSFNDRSVKNKSGVFSSLFKKSA